MGKHSSTVALLDDLAGIHHRAVVAADFGDDAKIMGESG